MGLKIQIKHFNWGTALFIAGLGTALIISCRSEGNPVKKAPSDLDAAKQTIEGILKADDIRLAKGLDYADKRATSKYFDSVLVRLFYEEEQCKEITREICNLDANPIYSAQDYSQDGIQVRIENESQSPRMVFAVNIRNGIEQTLKYFLHKEEGQWKIEDIQYPGAGTLKAQLSNPKTKPTTSDRKIIVGSISCQEKEGIDGVTYAIKKLKESMRDKVDSVYIDTALGNCGLMVTQGQKTTVIEGVDFTIDLTEKINKILGTSSKP
jgi:hypothetical protein